mmetsp:Transcript_8648/g.19751  ORF Transcript_8648/g.19751 Transcript_8648/m.19751 type:complete len:282 (-) Transcript_8648:69-914(-)
MGEADVVEKLRVGCKQIPNGALLPGPAVVGGRLDALLVPVGVIVAHETQGVIADRPNSPEEVCGLLAPLDEHHCSVCVHLVPGGAARPAHPQPGVWGDLAVDRAVPLALVQVAAVISGAVEEGLKGNVRVGDDHLWVHPDKHGNVLDEVLHHLDLVPILGPVGKPQDVLLDGEGVAVTLRILEHDGGGLRTPIGSLVETEVAPGDDAEADTRREVLPRALGHGVGRSRQLDLHGSQHWGTLRLQRNALAPLCQGQQAQQPPEGYGTAHSGHGLRPGRRAVR